MSQATGRLITNPSRRAVLAGAAAMILAAAIADSGLSTTQVAAPIFAAIERRRAAHMRRLEAGAVRSQLRPRDQGFVEARAADEEAWDAKP